MEDSEIINLFFRRSQEAIPALAEKYGPLCYSLSNQILQDWRDAEECVSDAYLGVWNTVPPKRPDPFRAYLCKIVRNLSITRYRANRAAKRNSQYQMALEELGDCISGGTDPAEAMEANELAGMLNDFLGSLPRRDRVLFLGRYWFADSIREAGARVGISEKNASVRLTRLRKALRSYLEERGVTV